jgi:hypothetical protein
VHRGALAVEADAAKFGQHRRAERLADSCPHRRIFFLSRPLPPGFVSRARADKDGKIFCIENRKALGAAAAAAQA